MEMSQETALAKLQYVPTTARAPSTRPAPAIAPPGKLARRACDRDISIDSGQEPGEPARGRAPLSPRSTHPHLTEA